MTCSNASVIIEYNVDERNFIDMNGYAKSDLTTRNCEEIFNSIINQIESK